MKKVLLLFLLLVVLGTTSAVVEIRQAELVARDYELVDTAYFNNRYTTYFYLLNAGNEPTQLLNVNLDGYALPHTCFPEEPPAIRQAYILQYNCVSDIIACSDQDRFSYTPFFEYIQFTDHDEVRHKTLTLPTKNVLIKSPLQLIDLRNQSHIEMTLNRGYRLSLMLENKGLSTHNTTFQVYSPSYVLLEVITPRGTLLPEEFEKYYVQLGPEESVPLTFYLIPKYPGVGERLAIRVFDKNDPCADAVFYWDVTVWAVFGRLVRILSSADMISILLLLSGTLLIINKDKLFKK